MYAAFQPTISHPISDHHAQPTARLLCSKSDSQLSGCTLRHMCCQSLLDDIVRLCHAGRCSERPEAIAQLLLPLAQLVVQGLVRALLAPSPLVRVHKVTTILASLACLQVSGQQDLPEPELALLQWLSSALDSVLPGKLIWYLLSDSIMPAGTVLSDGCIIILLDPAVRKLATTCKGHHFEYTHWC